MNIRNVLRFGIPLGSSVLTSLAISYEVQGYGLEPHLCGLVGTVLLMLRFAVVHER